MAASAKKIKAASGAQEVLMLRKRVNMAAITIRQRLKIFGRFMSENNVRLEKEKSMGCLSGNII